MLRAYDAGDRRLDASIGVVEGVINASGDFVPEVVRSILGYKAQAGKVGKRFSKNTFMRTLYPINIDDNWPVYQYDNTSYL